jgi:hypothetical protein
LRYHFDTDDESAAVAALLLYATWRSRERREGVSLQALRARVVASAGRLARLGQGLTPHGRGYIKLLFGQSLPR